MQLKIKNDGKKPSRVVHFGAISYGKNIYLRIITKDGLDLSIWDTPQDLLDELHRLIQKIKMVAIEANSTEGVLHLGESESQTAKQFNLITTNDLADLPPDRATALLIERFRNTLPDIAACLMADYKTITGHTYGHAPEISPAPDAPAPPAHSQIEMDVMAIWQYANEQNGAVVYINKDDKQIELITADGQPGWGAQTAVAEILGTTTGGGHRPRILAALDALTTRKRRVA